MPFFFDILLKTIIRDFVLRFIQGYWTKTLLTHPHVHCLVTGQGLSPSGELKHAVKDFLLPYDVIKDAFRGRMQHAILKAFDKGELVLPEDMRAQQLKLPAASSGERRASTVRTFDRFKFARSPRGHGQCARCCGSGI